MLIHVKWDLCIVLRSNFMIYFLNVMGKLLLYLLDSTFQNFKLLYFNLELIILRVYLMYPF